MTGFLSGSIGRKRTIIFLCLPLIGGWTTIGLSGGNVTWLCVGRILQGVGIMSSVSQVYLVEMADAKRRGWMGGSGALSVSAGITMVYVLGACLNWRWVCLCCGLHVLVVIVAMMFMPETPNWLIIKNRRDDAVRTLLWLRGPNHNVEEEIKDLSSKLLTGNDSGSMMGKYSGQLSEPSNLKPFLLLIILFVLMQLTGTFAVIFYAVNVFQDAGVTNNSYIVAILVGFIRLVGTLIGTLLLQKVPRKILLITSGILMALSLSGLSLDLYISKTSEDQEASPVSQCVIVTCLIVYMLSFGIGIGTVPWLLLGELTPGSIKGITSGVVTCSTFFTIFLVVKIFPLVIKTIGTSGTYLGFAGVCLITSLFSYLCIPETKDKTMAEVMTLFETKNERSENTKD